MPAQASKALCSLLFCPERKQYLLKTPDPESDKALPFKRAKDTQTVSLLLRLFPSGERNLLHCLCSCSSTDHPSFPPRGIFPILLAHSRQPSRPEVIALKRSSGLQSHTQHPRQQSPQKSTELMDPLCHCQFPALGLPQLCQQTGRSQKLMESGS